MATSRKSLCVCDHWNDVHKEVWDEKTHESFYPCTKCKPGECPDFEPDAAATRDAENEAKQLRWDIDHGK